jgi:hypothetical protein
VYGSICALFGFILYGFPVRSYNKDKLNNIEQKNNSSNIIENQKLTRFKKLTIELKDFLQKLKKAFKNIPLLFIIIATASEGIILKGFLGFISKYFEYQFQMSASTSTLFVGGIALVSVIAGTLSSAFIINKYKWGGKECSVFCFLIYFFTSFCFWIFLNYCKEIKFSNDNYNISSCTCINQFNPVCLLKNSSINNSAYSIYQSGCHAGCQSYISNSQFTNCQYLDLTSISKSLSLSFIVSSSYCDNSIKCKYSLIVNCIAAAIVIFFTAFALIPQLKACMSTVDQDFQVFALGIRAGIVRILGNFSGTLIVGNAIDLTCKYWLKNCYNQKTCKLYFNDKMSFTLAVIGFSCRFVTAIFMGGAVILIIKKEKEFIVNSKEENKLSEQRF